LPLEVSAELAYFGLQVRQLLGVIARARLEHDLCGSIVRTISWPIRSTYPVTTESLSRVTSLRISRENSAPSCFS